MTTQRAFYDSKSPLMAEKINVALREHQASAEKWDFKAVAADLHQWAERFVLEFKLQVGVPALMIQRLRRRYGHFRPGRNGFGLIDEIGMDEFHVRTDPYWQVCGTLLHELLHAWQQLFGSPGSRNYHNKQFRDKALDYGLRIDTRGFTQYIPGNTPFFSLLKKHGVTPPELPYPQEPSVSRTGSKLRLWECSCGVKVRVGRARFHARCLDCGSMFVLQGHRMPPGKDSSTGLTSITLLQATVLHLPSGSIPLTKQDSNHL